MPSRRSSKSAGFARYVPQFCGAIFLTFGILKAVTPQPLGTALAYYGFSESTITALSLTIILAEVVIGILLIYASSYRAVTLSAMLLLAVFTMHLGFFVVQNNAPECGCSGIVKLFKSTRHAALFGIGRNLLLECLLYYFYSQVLRAYRSPLLQKRSTNIGAFDSDDN